MNKFKTLWFALFGAVTLFSNADAMTLKELRESEEFHEGDTIKVGNKFVTIYGTSQDFIGSFCPGGSTILVEGNKVTEPFGTCSEDFDLKVIGDKIVITQSGFAGPFEGEQEQRKAAKEKYQFTYHNGKVTRKRIK